MFSFIFGSPPSFFLSKRNFEISKTEVAKISFTLHWKSYHLKDIFLLKLIWQNCCLKPDSHLPQKLFYLFQWRLLQISLLNYVPSVLSCPTWLRALRTFVPYMLRALCVLISTRLNYAPCARKVIKYLIKGNFKIF